MDTKHSIFSRISNIFSEAQRRGQQARREAIEREAVALDRKHTQKALKRSPESPVLITRVITTGDAQMLIGKGWRLTSSNRLQQWGSDLMSEHWLEKNNPNL